MLIDPAESQEGAREDATTVTDPQVTEEAAESPEEPGEGAGAAQEDQEVQEAAQAAADEIEIRLEGEEPPPPKEKAPWVKELREKHRALAAENAELKRKLQSQAQPEQAADPGPEPTLEDCDFDQAVFKQRLSSHIEATERKKVDDARKAQQAEAQHRAWQSKVAAYGTAAADLSKQIPGFKDAEAAFTSVFDVPRQGLLLSVTDNPALVVCALGQRPKLLEEFAKEQDPLVLARKLWKLEASLKTEKRTKVPPPENPVRGTGSSSGSVDSHLKKLEAEAAKSGDRTEVIAYKRKQRQQS